MKFVTKFAASGLSLCVSAQAQIPANALTDFRAYTRDLTSLSGSFTQEVRDKNGRVSRQSAGTFAIARPGKFRFTYEKPYKQTIVSDVKRMVFVFCKASRHDNSAGREATIAIRSSSTEASALRGLAST